jgi:hypothetical protein
MKEKLISDFENYLRVNNIKNFSFSSTYSEIKIIVSLLNYRTLIDIFLGAIISYCVYNTSDKTFYLIPILLAYFILAIVIWYDFRLINIIAIDMISKNISIESRNPFQRLYLKYFTKTVHIYTFNNVDGFIVRSNLASKANIEIYILEMKIKNKIPIVLLSFAKEYHASYTGSFLSQLIRP